MFSEEDSALLCSSDYQYWMQPAPSPSESLCATLHHVGTVCAHGQKHVKHRYKSKWGSLKQTFSPASQSATDVYVLAAHDLSNVTQYAACMH